MKARDTGLSSRKVLPAANIKQINMGILLQQNLNVKLISSPISEYYSCWVLQTPEVEYKDNKIFCEKVCQVGLGCDNRNGVNVCPTETDGGTLDQSKARQNFVWPS